MIVNHPLFNQEFEQQPDGLVRVTDKNTGKQGWFDKDGHPVRGELTWADPQLLDWVGGRPIRPADS